MSRNSSQLGTSDSAQKPSLSALHTALGRTLEMDMPVDTDMKRLFTPSRSRVGFDPLPPHTEPFLFPSWMAIITGTGLALSVQ